jgi:DNA replication protein DnaC
MLERNCALKRPAEIIREEIRLAPGETQQSRFKTWLSEKLAVPRFCAKHPHLQLVYEHSDESGVWTTCEDWHPCERPRVVPGVFIFRAALRCPACRVAYALCPPEFHETSFDTFDTSTPERTATLARAREFVVQVNKQGCGFALFVGPTGPGKTRLACNVVRKLENSDAFYVRQGELTCALRATYGRKEVILRRQQARRLEWNHDECDGERDDDTRPTPLEICQDVYFLVLDELGCTAFANDERLFLDELLKHRYEHRKPTILISNLPLTGTPDKPGLKEFLGDALTDRIKEATGNGKFIVQFTGESYRRSTGEKYLGGVA